jgi:anti-sigma B factor antagonist
VADVLILNHGAVDGMVTIALFGEMDLATRDLLATTLDTCVATTTSDVRLDCAELDFLDATSLGVLVRVHEQLERNGRRLFVVRANPNIRRVFRLSRLDQVLHVA